MAVQRSESVAFDRTPPQNLDAERSVLGSMLINSDAVGPAIEILQSKASDAFYSGAHQKIYDAAIQLFGESKPVDYVTIVEQLSRNKTLEDAGGATYVSGLSAAVPISANVEHYAHIVLEASILRRLISACTRVAGDAYSAAGDANLLLDQAESEIFSIAEKRQLNPVYKVGDLLTDGIKRIEKMIEAKTGITGIATGFTKLDEMTSGLQPSDMVVLAARPSVGKTALALNIASHAAVGDGKNVLLFSLEMSKEQLVQRLLCMEGNIDSQRLRTGFLATKEFSKLQQAADKLDTAPIFIDDTANISVLDLRSKARRHAAQHGLDMVVIDYLQLMSSSRRVESRQVEISEISRSIKGIARELSVPVMALSQLSREAEKDDTGSPKLLHLRESGAIEQDADVVLMLSRPSAHEQEQNRNLIKLDIAKQRNGPTGNMELLFDRNVQRFRNMMDGAGGGHGSPPPGSFEQPPFEEEFEGDGEVPF
ncbi:MAG: replicative DNA helicase [Candidatus Hydrogenedentes bacterium]|jgi:replicative DNA helicase|nr:replicative DNA helicase [Candidatus Hydrogenedentota bacterium]